VRDKILGQQLAQRFVMSLETLVHGTCRMSSKSSLLQLVREAGTACRPRGPRVKPRASIGVERQESGSEQATTYVRVKP